MGLWRYGTPLEYSGQGLGMLARVVVWDQMRRTLACPMRGARLFGPEPSYALFVPDMFMLDKRQTQE